MRKVRKGFTLVELLIVIVLIGVLTATMSVSTTKATAAGKAAAIIASVDACMNASRVYLAYHQGEDLTNKTAGDFLKDEFIPNFSKLSTGSTTFTAGDDQGADKWNVVVDFSKEPDWSDIAAALAGKKGYEGLKKAGSDGDTTTTNYYNGFSIVLSTGEVTGKDSTSTTEPAPSTGE